MPIPTLPLPCCTTNCEPPTVKPWPEAMVVVPVVPVKLPACADKVPVSVKLPTTVEDACETNPLVKVPRPARLRAPVLVNVLVAVAPKYAGP